MKRLIEIPLEAGTLILVEADKLETHGVVPVSPGSDFLNPFQSAQCNSDRCGGRDESL
jgi:hypothetical protein